MESVASAANGRREDELKKEGIGGRGKGVGGGINYDATWRIYRGGGGGGGPSCSSSKDGRGEGREYNRATITT